MKVTRSAIPLYFQIARILRSQIQSGEYKPNDLMPTEDEMIRAYGVSRTTVRQALQVLLSEGLIYRIAGKGTFVASEARVKHGDWSVGSIEEMIAAHLITKLRDFERKSVSASEDQARAFQVPPGAELIQFCGIREVDDAPFFHFNLFVPAVLGAKIPTERIREKPIIALMEDYCGVRIEGAHQWMAASLVSSEIARYLHLKPGDPALLIERHYYDTIGRIVGMTTDHYRTDLMRHYLRVKRVQNARTPE